MADVTLDAVLVVLGEAITKLRTEGHDPLDVANDLALAHAAVSCRQANSDRSPVPTPPAAGRGEGAAHLTLIRGGVS